MSDDQKILGEFMKNATERIRTTISTYKEKRIFSVRTYYQTDDDEWRPTKKGISMTLDKFEEFAKLIKDAESKLKNEIKEAKKEDKE